MKASQLPEQQTYGLGTAVVLNLLSCLPNDRFYKIYFDNLFTSLPLLDKLTELGHLGIGTIRENRTEHCPLEGQRIMKKKKRGAMTMKTTAKIAFVQWHDNSVVMLASNAYGISPVSNVNHVGTINKKRTKITVPCPNVVSIVMSSSRHNDFLYIYISFGLTLKIIFN